MIYIMSDIHGGWNEYRDILEQIQFSDNDHLYMLGDAIDRGPDGIEVLLDIMARKNVTMLLGNHEKMMLDALRKRDAEALGLLSSAHLSHIERNAADLRMIYPQYFEE